jgi:transcriptional regulator with XRE-family HTH domain
MILQEYLNEKKLTDKQVAMIKGELDDGQSSKSSIAKRYGVSVGHINDIEKGARREDVKIEPKVQKLPKLETYGTKRDVQPGELSDQDVRDIRASKEKPGDLAKKYGVSDIHIRDIQANKRRKNVV